MASTSKHSDFGALEPLTGERMAAPKAVESDSDAAWSEFERLAQMTATQFGRLPHLAAAKPGGAPEFDATMPAFALPSAAPEEPRMPPSHALTLHDVMVEARRYNRVCPKPDAWNELYDMLPGKVAQGGRTQPAPPITGAAWNGTSAMPKRMCLRDHIEWAEHHGALESVMYFLKSLPEDQWHHMDD